MSEAISCNALIKRYKGKTALDALTLSIEENKIVGLIGRNGAGKTTFLKTCAGFIKPTAGEIKVFGMRPFDRIETSSETLYIDETMQYDDSFRLEDILEICRICYKNWDAEFAKKLIKHFEINVKSKYTKLSLGIKTQFGMILGLASRSRLTLLDEPTLGLDAAARRDFNKILMDDYIRFPRTFIISSHLMTEMENLFEEMILIHEGKLVFQKPMDELQGYAVSISGRIEIMDRVLAGKKVINREEFGNSVIAGVINDLTNQETAYLEKNGADITRAKVEDILVWLTDNGKGGGMDEL
jgi:ABC-2 type transport system ATP-binding protein